MSFTTTPEGRLHYRVSSLGLQAVRGEEEYVARIVHQPLAAASFAEARAAVRHLGVTDRFRDVIDAFDVPAGETPAGFRIEFEMDSDAVMRADLVRDISHDANGRLRPTRVLYSADTANPYELAPIAPLLANLTCNPGIIYDLFINNPDANVGHKFATRDEVMAEIGRILGPGADISVELNNPFEQDFNKILEEAEHFKEMLSEHRVVIKVPHTGPVNHSNVHQLLEGDKRLDRRWDAPATGDALVGHNLALRLHEHGFRVNYTLMFDPHQTQMALQSKPYFINSFIRHRLVQTTAMADFLSRHAQTGDDALLVELRDYLVATDYLSSRDLDADPQEAKALAEHMVAYRHLHDPEGADGLDSVRHNLRCLRNANLPDTRLIICSMEGPSMYGDIDKLLATDEFADMTGRVVITAEPGYLARFTSSNQVVSYQRRFMNAAAGER